MTDASATQLKQRLVTFWNTQQLYWDGMNDEVSANSPDRQRAASFIPEGSHILDVTCGSAENAQWLKPRGTYFGSDNSQLGLRLVHDEVDDRMRGFCALVRLPKRVFYFLLSYRHARSTELPVFEQ